MFSWQGKQKSLSYLFAKLERKLLIAQLFKRFKCKRITDR